jgi:hypothetical protein
MSYLVYVDGAASWSASSLRGAMWLAQEYADGRHQVQVIGRNSSEKHVWTYDDQRSDWTESVVDAAS